MGVSRGAVGPAGRWAVVAAVVCAAAGAARAQDEAAARGLIVKLRPAATVAQAQRLPGPQADAERLQRVLDAAGVRAASTRALGSTMRHVDFGRVLPGADAAQLAQRLRQRPEVEWVEPNVREKRLQNMPVPNDPSFGNALQWWLQPPAGSDANVKALRLRGVPGVQQAWMQTMGSAAAVVAVLDTGITAHPDLDGHVLPGYDFVADVDDANDGSGRDADPRDPGDWVSAADAASPAFSGCGVEDSSWHGTKIAGMVAALTNNARGVAGINWNGRVLPVRVAGKCGASVTDIVDGMRWAAGLAVVGVPANPHPARIVNISFGGDGSCNVYDEVVADLRAAGAVVVAAAGNAHAAPLRPAKCAGVVGVVALNRDGFKASYSNFGAELSASGLATVGGDYATVDSAAWDVALGDSGLYTLVNDGRTVPGAASYGAIAGTSFSAPLVAGVASLMLSANPALSADQLVAGLGASARPHVQASRIAACSDANPGRCICTTTTCGRGILDAVQAIAYARNPSGYQAPAWPTVMIGSSGEARADLDDALSVAARDRPANGTGGSDGGGGGGALGAGWLLGLALAVLSLARGPRRPAGR